ncbi:MAG: hypothetical protein IPO78_10315 [Saprospiraceae bacterium]|nr:hypothetical protein [Saprospiraceae bacterium]
MAVYSLEGYDWEVISSFWENEFPDKFKNETVFQMEPFPKEGFKTITFISTIPEAVTLVEQKFEIKKNEYWTSVGSQGIKRLTGTISKWKDIPLKIKREYIPMTKPQWESIIKELENCYDEFLLEYHNSEKGKNKKIRADGLKAAKRVIERTKRIIISKEEVFELLIADGSDYGRAIVMDEFSSPKYFNSDMSELIFDIRRKIGSL